MGKTTNKIKRAPADILRDNPVIDAAVKRAVREELARQDALARIRTKTAKVKRRAKAA